MKRLKTPEDLFKATNMVDKKTTGYEKVETLFCDSSGFGTEGERALTKDQAIEAVRGILKSNGDTPLYAGLTGIGQFQVYVTIYKKS